MGARMNAWDYLADRVAVTSSGCWEWKQCRDQSGYGRLTFEKRTWLAHRFAWSLEHDIDPGKGCILHSCDNPPCCNPDHLRLGTLKENNKEMFAKGRGKVYVSRSAYPEVVRLHLLGHTRQQIGDLFGVHRTTISLILAQLGYAKFRRKAVA